MNLTFGFIVDKCGTADLRLGNFVLIYLNVQE